jgi:hypothetical protein
MKEAGADKSLPLPLRQEFSKVFGAIKAQQELLDRLIKDVEALRDFKKECEGG